MEHVVLQNFRTVNLCLERRGSGIFLAPKTVSPRIVHASGKGVPIPVIQIPISEQ